MLKELFNEQRSLVNAFFDAIDLEKAQKVLDACLQCQGKIVFSGIGKSGIVAEKLATTLTSTGTQSIHLLLDCTATTTFYQAMPAILPFGETNACRARPQEHFPLAMLGNKRTVLLGDTLNLSRLFTLP